MNLQQFRSNKHNVKKASDLLSTPDMKLMLDVLRDNRPFKLGGHRTLPTGLNLNDHSLLLGLIQGYELAIQDLRDMGEPLPEPIAPIQETYPHRSQTLK